MRVLLCDYILYGCFDRVHGVPRNMAILDYILPFVSSCLHQRVYLSRGQEFLLVSKFGCLHRRWNERFESYLMRFDLD